MRQYTEAERAKIARADAWLQRAEQAYEIWREAKDDCRELRTRIMSPGSDASAPIVQGDVSDRVGDGVSRLVDAAQRRADLMDRYLSERRAVGAAIAGAMYADLLRARYVRMMSWAQVAQDAGIAISTAYDRRAEGLLSVRIPGDA